MVGNTGQDGKNTEINRRNVMKAVGTGALAAVGTGVASGTMSDRSKFEYEEITGREARYLAYKLRKTIKFDQLVEIVDEKGATLANVEKAGRVRTDSTIREIVSFRIRNGPRDEGYLTIGRDRDEGVSVGKVEFNTYADDGILQEHVVYDVVAERENGDTVSLSAGNGSAVVRTITPEAEIRRSIEGARRRIENDEISASGICWECKAAAVLICQNACGYAGGFACGFLGLTGIGGVSCVTLVSVVCGLKSMYACGKSGIGEAACEEVGLC